MSERSISAPAIALLSVAKVLWGLRGTTVATLPVNADNNLIARLHQEDRQRTAPR